ncbi:hypothetical protein ACFO1B_39940 [Dactylosporangium siamense]|uniref:hypothetical protein n=1 Tax=Dactylosporangium siamense TaxID=685454 RepID=UPI00194078CB|nr:hypothetical protein [Dactylosporangium siamense]
MIGDGGPLCTGPGRGCQLARLRGIVAAYEFQQLLGQPEFVQQLVDAVRFGGSVAMLRVVDDLFDPCPA